MKRRRIAVAVDAALAAPERERWILSNRASIPHRYVAFMAAKVACSTIKLALHQFESPDVVLENWWSVHDDRPGSRLVDHPRRAVIEMMTSPDWFRFCFVRNPFDRLASAWKQKLLPGGDRAYVWLQDAVRNDAGASTDADVTFRDSVEYLLAGHSNMVSDPHWLPMTTVLRPDIVRYGAIGRFENFAADFRSILERIGAPSDVVAMASVVTNASRHVPLRPLFDSALARRVYEHYQADFDAFGYSVDSWRDL